MVYQVIWTLKALESYVANMRYLEQAWTEKEVKNFAALVEKKIKILSGQPEIGSSKSKRQPHVRQTIVHKRVSLIYRVKAQKKEIELLLFWKGAFQIFADSWRHEPGRPPWAVSSRPT